MQAVGYGRVSTEDQARDGVSLGTQEAKVEAYGLVKDWTLLKVIRDEGYRAKHLADLDKLIKRFERHHVARVSLQESLDATTATGRLMMKLLASVSHWEREVIGGAHQQYPAAPQSTGEAVWPYRLQQPRGDRLDAPVTEGRLQRRGDCPALASGASGRCPDGTG
jgi:hypothetical protein